MLFSNMLHKSKDSQFMLIWVHWGQLGLVGVKLVQAGVNLGQVGSRGTKGDKVGSRGTKRGQVVTF